MLFITLGVLKDHLQRPDFPLPETIAEAQREFDGKFAMALIAMADRMEGRLSAEHRVCRTWIAPLERAIETYRPQESQQTLFTRFQWLISLDRRIQDLVISLAEGSLNSADES
jgi:hypothetical protein